MNKYLRLGKPLVNEQILVKLLFVFAFPLLFCHEVLMLSMFFFSRYCFIVQNRSRSSVNTDYCIYLSKMNTERIAMHSKQQQQQKEDEQFMSNHRDGRNGRMKTKHKIPKKKKLPKQKHRHKENLFEKPNLCVIEA